jgi:hypothetical protein
VFKKTVENFICGHCGHTAKGDGYTNHCPECLWSKHVDVGPGDRRHKCGGMMQPIGLVKNRKDLALLHQCLKCGIQKKNRASKNDNSGLLALFSANPIKI